MKTVTFFSEKGGVGKTTITAMFASWLCYSQEENVWVMDFDSPNYQFSKMREHELILYEQESGRELRRAVALNPVEGYYRIGQAGNSTLDHYTKEDLEGLIKRIKKYRESCKDGYFFFDFPGRFLPSDPSYVLMKEGLIDYVVFIGDSDRQSLSSICYVNAVMRQLRGNSLNCSVLFNKESKSERDSRNNPYDEAQRLLAGIGIDIIGTRMRDVLSARRDADNMRFIRSTICWPEKNIAITCPYVTDIFREIKEKIDKTK